MHILVKKFNTAIANAIRTAKLDIKLALVVILNLSCIAALSVGRDFFQLWNPDVPEDVLVLGGQIENLRGRGTSYFQTRCFFAAVRQRSIVVQRLNECI